MIKAHRHTCALQGSRPPCCSCVRYHHVCCARPCLQHWGNHSRQCPVPAICISSGYKNKRCLCSPAVCPPSPQLWHDSLAGCVGAGLQLRWPLRRQSPQRTCCRSVRLYCPWQPPSALRQAKRGTAGSTVIERQFWWIFGEFELGGSHEQGMVVTRATHSLLSVVGERLAQCRCILTHADRLPCVDSTAGSTFHALPHLSPRLHTPTRHSRTTQPPHIMLLMISTIRVNVLVLRATHLTSSRSPPPGCFLIQSSG